MRVSRWLAAAVLAVAPLAGCGPGQDVAGSPVRSPAASATETPVPRPFSTGTAVADPPAEPRPPQPVDAETAAVDARSTAAVRALLAGCDARGWTLCAALGDHYLGRSGAPVVVDVGRMLRELPTLTALVRQHAGGSGWLPYDCPADTDWAYALGHVEVRVVAGRVEVADVYDFDAGAPFGSFRALADHGRAAEFLVTGAAPLPS